MSFSECPHLGFGVGIRHPYYPEFYSRCPPGIGWVEAIAENFMAWDDRKPRRYTDELLRIRKNVPVALHGTSLSVGSAEPVDRSYLERFRELIAAIEPAWVSDHLCWTGLDKKTSHDLLPLPYTEEALRRVSDNIGRAQDFLGRRILIENVSSYLEFENSEMTEWEFLTAVAERADCGILLDVNNIYVSSINHGFDPLEYLRAIPVERVGQIHLAGHSDEGGYCIDTHDEPVRDEVWSLYRVAARRFGAVSTMIERDDKMPPWDVLITEVECARRIWKEENGKSRSRDVPTSISIRP